MYLFNLNGDNESYAISFNHNFDAEVDKDLVLPCEYKGKPVTKIDDFGFRCCEFIESIVIPHTIENIGLYAFDECASLSTLIIPDSVLKIDARAFGKCSSLLSIVIPQSVTSIGAAAFLNCSSLNSITIPHSVTLIEPSVFKGCTALTSIEVDKHNKVYDSRDNCNAIIETRTNTLVAGCTNTIITSNIKEIGEGAFSGQSSLQTIDLPNSIETIGRYAFANCTGLKKVIIPSSVKRIGEGAFHTCISLSTITIPDLVTVIEDDTFSSCSSLQSFVIGPKVKKLGFCAFSWCKSLTSLLIPKSVTEIGQQCFAGCSSLMSIMVENGNPTYDSRDNCQAIIETKSNTLIAGCSSTVIPATVETIKSFAFSGCKSLTSITINKNIKMIEGGAFSQCPSLTSIVVEKDNTIYDSRNNCHAIIETNTNTLVVGCASTIIPDTVEVIDYYAFYGCSISSIIIPKSVKTIEEDAFIDCDSMIIYAESPDEIDDLFDCWEDNNCPPVYYYSESPNYDDRHWRYVDGVPSIWKER